MVIHYELGNYDLLDYLIKSTERFFNKRSKALKLGYEFEAAFVGYFKKLSKALRQGERASHIFKEMKEDLALLLMNRNEKVALEYFDYLTWVEAQILSMPYGELRKTNYNSALGK